MHFKINIGLVLSYGLEFQLHRTILNGQLFMISASRQGIFKSKTRPGNTPVFSEHSNYANSTLVDGKQPTKKNKSPK